LKILFATSNKHKIGEANEIGEGFGVEFEQLLLGYPEIRDEDVEEVANEGAKFVYEKVNKAIVVEDAGLYIEALNGFPGPYSAFVHEKIGNAGILRLLKDEKDRTAKMISAIGYCDEKGVKTFKGVVEGEIANEVSGSAGFGYDPIFIPLGFKRTFAEDFELKSMVSHRTKAFKAFCEFIVNKD